MHPILSSRRRIVIYLFAWIPITGLLAYLLTVFHEISDVEALALAIPLCFLHALVCLSSWYSCRGNPLDKYSLGRLLSTHITAALVSAIIWAFTAVGLASSLSRFPAFEGLSRRFRPRNSRDDRHGPSALSAVGRSLLRNHRRSKPPAKRKLAS